MKCGLIPIITPLHRQLKAIHSNCIFCNERPMARSSFEHATCSIIGNKFNAHTI